MKNDIKEEYSAFTIKKQSVHCYPTEWVIRTFLGNYPNLKMINNNYKSKNILDLGFGDGRNLELLHNCGFNVYGVEITESYVDHVKKSRLNNFNADLRVGSNKDLPFDPHFFDYILCSSSIYYIDNNGKFEEVIEEVYRVLKPGGYLVANFPLEGKDEIFGIDESFILKGAIRTEDRHIIVQNDLYNLRNGYKLKTIHNEEELLSLFSEKFQNFGFSKLYENYFGVQINSIVMVCQKKF